MCFLVVLGLAMAQSDVRLDAPITMRVKCEALSDFAADLTKLTKVHFSVATAISDRKITTIFKDRPTKEVMQAVKGCMFMDWKKDGGGYLLVMPRDAQRDEEAAIKADQEAIRKGLVSGLKALYQAAGMTETDRAKKLDDLKRQMTLARNSSDPDVRKKWASLAEERGMYGSSAGQALALDYAADFDRDADDLMAGRTLVASTRSTDACPVLPPDFLDKLSSRSGGSISGASALALMRVNESDQSLEAQAIIAPAAGERRGNSVTEFLFYHPSYSDSEADQTKLVKKLRDWPKNADSSVIGRMIESSGAAAPARRLTLADALESLADNTGIPVIGDAFRLYGPRVPFTGTVKDYIVGLSKSIGSSPPTIGYYTAEHGWLFVRHARYWNRLATEVPESALRPMEEAAKRNSIPTLAEYGKFALGLTPAQANAFIFNPNAMAVNFDTFPFQPAFCSIRLFGSFSDAQVGALQKGPLPLSTLSVEQRRLLTSGLVASIWRGGVPSDLWGGILSPSGLNYDSMQLSCRVSSYPMGQDGSPLPRSEVIQDQSLFTYMLGSQQFTEMCLARKNFGRPDFQGE